MVWHDRTVPNERQARPEGDVAVALRDALPWRAFAGLVRRAESVGYRAIFLPEIAGRDALATLAALAGETSTLGLATGVIPINSRSPMLTAMAGATVHERSGRLVLGLGTGPPAPGALDRLRSLVVALRQVFAAGEAAVEGRPLRVSLAMPTPPPVWIAALGPRAMQLAGEVADGVILNWCTPERVAAAKDEIADGARLAGRDPGDVTVAVYVRAALDDDHAEALAALKAAAGEYATYPAYARQFRRMGLGGAAEQAAEASRERRPWDVPGDLVEQVCLVGDVSEARERLRRYRTFGADLPVIYPVASNAASATDSERTGADVAASVGATVDRLAPIA
jgi:alkanesulfonate monooxygenase SsuD/methylene tetrahydromethanopterin reductase-like flavin-dependent oxidoreductase (luciferase family)